MAYRTQLSLLVPDEDLYNNFIVPLKRDKELHSIILKCLSAYYYNESIRNLIEGVSSDGVETGESVPSSEEAITDMRNMLALQNIIVKDIEGQLQDDFADFSNVLKDTNKVAQENELIKDSDSAFGGSGKLNREKLVETRKETFASKPVEIDETYLKTKSDHDIVMELASIVFSRVDASDVSDSFKALYERVSKSGTETSIDFEERQVLSTSSEGLELFEEIVSESSEKEPEPEVPMLEQHSIGEAADALAEIFGSLTQ